ncbi:hypothetical protein G6F64_015405 [Rhizopus arrhizus]|uniref:Uncharacterized protein n=1 Tax=Rhizopus oryzae TaxID=64495 RepID=A0A9P6WRJ8_RHIOR|nr:hypothetical protein G6F64_015405 [Rhizopus arrhizus]
MSRAPARPRGSQMNPLTRRPSSSSSVPMPRGAGISATTAPNAVTGTSQSSTSMGAPDSDLTRPGLGGVVLASAYRR